MESAIDIESRTDDRQPGRQISPSEAVAERDMPVAKGDKHIWGIYILLIFISVIELYSASSREVSGAGFGVFGPIVRHGLMLIAGFFIILFLQRTPYRKLIKFIPVFALVSVGMMIYTLLFGDVINGARRSFHIGFLSIQPSEFLKLSAALMIAQIMARNQVKGGGVTKKGVMWSAGIILFYCALLAPQGLTNTLLLMSISLSMMIVGGISLKRLGQVVLVYVLLFGAYVGVTHMRESKRAGTEQVDEDAPPSSRLSVWVDRIGSYIGTGTPKYEEPLTSDNRQEMLGYMAQAHGGVTGWPH